MSTNSTESIQSQAHSSSTASFEAALVLNAAIFGAEMLAFTLLRTKFKVIYQPRTFLTPEDKRTEPLSQKLYEWPLSVWNADPEQIQHHNGLDAYMFVRFLRMMVKILLPIWIISWAVLLPVDSAGTSVPGLTGLDKFTFGNIAPNAQVRYAAHIILVWLFTGYILYTLRTELQHFIVARQRHLVDPVHSSTAQANTILVTGVPQSYLSEPAITELFRHVPGGVKKVWLNRDLGDLPGVYERRLAACSKLEAAENTLLKTAAKIQRKKIAKNAKEVAVEDVERNGNEITEAERLVPRNEWPTHRLPVGAMPFALPLIGKKVDTIEWARNEILETNKILEKERSILHTEIRNAKKRSGLLRLPLNLLKKDKDNMADDDAHSKKYPPLSAAFVLFHQQIGAHIAAQCLTHHAPFRMADKYIDVSPDDVVWGNLGLNPYEASIRRAISYALTAGLIVVWAIPVAFVGIVSNVAGLCATYSWLAWLCKLPKSVVGIIQGILPPVLLAVLFMLLPIVLRLLARFEGIPTRSGIELSLMTRYFLFLVIHGFLVVTISSGIIAALPGLVSNPGSIPTLLANKLPSASTFFLTYIVLQGLSGVAGGFLTIVPLVLYYVKMFILGSTPRSIFNIKYTLRNVTWGTTWPPVTLLVVITLGYSIISPIINGLAFLTFFLFYALYKYLFIWQLDMPASGETGGLFFPKAIQHVFVGLYIQQICLCALFFLARNERNEASAVPQGALMIVLIVLTAFFNYLLNSSYAPLLTSLPLTLADRSHGTSKAVEAVEEHESEGGRSDADEGALADAEASGSEGQQILRRRGSDKPPSQDPDDKMEGKSPINEKAGTEDSAFEHPAGSEEQRPIWIADDALGLGREQAEILKKEGVQASTVHAVMDEQGSVVLSGRPPKARRDW